MPMQLVGTRSRAIRRRTSKNGANLKTGQADGQEPQLRERKSAFAEAAKRSVETCSAGRAGAHPGAGGAARSYHFYDAAASPDRASGSFTESGLDDPNSLNTYPAWRCKNAKVFSLNSSTFS